MTLGILTSDLLPVRHAFFTREGGASSGIYASLNCGYGSTDQREMVAINRARVADALEVAHDRLTGIHQTHSATAIEVGAPQEGTAPKADALVTRTPGLAISILTADCQPVLFADAEHGVIGAAHAGWKGALDGILEATLDAMEALGAQRATTRAAIGPSISQRAYEVGPEFLDRFVDDDPENTRFFANGEGDRYQFDLIGYGLQRLRATGIGEAGWIGHCTYSDEDRFYSYRRSVHRREADYGRLISAIRL